ncbi:MAG: hypothetical protein E2O84_06260 [Bacteroidetes bacterium]|nr:MAG: hypothetical protein E2O84_06260 [Bacteroidota bacterium]
MKSNKIILLLAAFSFVMSGTAAAQELVDALRLVSSQYAEKYIEPFTSAFGADYNSGLFHTADNGPRNGFRAYLGVKIFATIISEDDKQFSTTYNVDVALDRIVNGKDVTLRVPALVTVRNAPTIFGDSLRGTVTVRALEDVLVTVDGEQFIVSVDTVFSFQTPEGLIDLPAMPAAAPQLEIGTILGTDLMLRYVPSITSEEVGRFGLIGVGIRHSISQYIPSLPFHLAIQGSWQQLFFDDSNDLPIIKLKTWAVNIQASKKLGIVTIYGGLQAEDSNVTVSYRFEGSSVIEDGDVNVDFGVADLRDPVDVSLDLDGANYLRALVGISIAAGPVVISTDFSLGSVQSASFGIGVSF